MRNQATRFVVPQPRTGAKRKTLRRLILGGCVLAAVGSTGCKTASSMPGAGLFGFKKSPSAEMLAGQGPSVTYPPTPGTNYNPTAIASKTAGTGGAAEIAANPSPTGPVPGNAAVANGFNNMTKPTGTAPPPSYVTGGWGGGSPGTPTGGTASSMAASGGFPAGPTAGPTAGPPTGPPTKSMSSMPPSFAGPYGQPVNPPNSSTGGPPYTVPGNASIPNYAQNAANPAVPAGNQNNQYSNITIPPTPGFEPPPNSAYQVASTAGLPGVGRTQSNSFAGPSPSNPAGTGASGTSTPAAGPQVGAGPQMAGGFTLPSGSVGTPARAASASIASGAGKNPTAGGYRPGSTAGATSYPNTPVGAPSGTMFR